MVPIGIWEPDMGTFVLVAFDFVLYVVAYTTARILLPTLTFKKVKVDALSPGEAGFNWLGFKRLSDGVLLCDSNSAGWIGVLIWVLVAIVALV
jgi:hypothetical protein